jgi:hypothetical protein
VQALQVVLLLVHALLRDVGVGVALLKVCVRQERWECRVRRGGKRRKRWGVSFLGPRALRSTLKGPSLCFLTSSYDSSARRRTLPPPHRPLGNFAPPVSPSSAGTSLHRSERTVRLGCRSCLPSPSYQPSSPTSSSNSEREKRTLPERKAPRSSTRVSESRLSARPVRIVFVVVVKMLARSRRGEEVRR